MNRSDLAVGAELYHAVPSDWSSGRPGCKAVVLAVERYESAHFEWGRTFRAGPRRGYGGVLVELHEGDRPPRVAVVQLGNLRGPYAEVAAQVAAGTATKVDRMRQQLGRETVGDD